MWQISLCGFFVKKRKKHIFFLEKIWLYKPFTDLSLILEIYRRVLAVLSWKKKCVTGKKAASRILDGFFTSFFAYIMKNRRPWGMPYFISRYAVPFYRLWLHNVPYLSYQGSFISEMEWVPLSSLFCNTNDCIAKLMISLRDRALC